MRCTNFLITGALIAASALASVVCAGDPDWIAHSKTGMVASDSPEASRIGANVLKAGGNAFDAAVATSFALAVARPQSTGLGGGGFMLAYVAGEKRFVALDFRESAPAGGTAEHYAYLHAQRGAGPSPSIYGGNAVAVPGQLAGLAEINKRFGSRPLAELIQPAIELAKEGFLVDRSFLSERRTVFNAFKKWPQLRQEYAQLADRLTPDGNVPKPGDKFKRPNLARALELIAKDGPDAFYRGPISTAIIEAVQAHGGLLVPGDLSGYRVVERQPLRISQFDTMREFRHEIVAMPPPSSGGVCLAEILNIIGAGASRSDIHPEEGRAHVLVEAMKHAFADRARWLGDPDFYPIPSSGLTSPRYAALCAQRIQAQQTLFWTDYGSSTPPPDDGGTSHFCIADQHGNIVAQTETINGSFGSLIVAEPYGIILNNEMDDFLTVRGEANLYGLVQGEANLVAPGKRPLSSMSPTIVLKNGKPLLVLGASGGPRIITSVLQVAQHVMDGRPIEEAMTELRLHHQWQPDEIYFDREPPAALVENLKQHGHQISDKRQTGIVQAIQFLDDGTMVGASDPKKGGRPAAAN
jgi:gamma-glutamyltranspeptidase/glutathione hydrolase